MKKVFFYLVLLSIIFIMASNAGEKRPKIGLVLSGGGARGLAHVGTLKLIDSLKIPIDYIVGTSMGGIVGGLYAIGYSGNEIEQIVRQTDWTGLFSDKLNRELVPYIQKKDDEKFVLELGINGFTPVIPSGMISGQNVISKFIDLTSHVESINNFDQFKIPFRCIAIDLITGNQVVLNRGSLAKAMRSTMAIPTVFSPVEWGDSLLIDGGVLNNFPTDVIKEMCADIVIGVNVGTRLSKREDLVSIIDVLEQAAVLTDYAKQQENAKLCDLLIFPELGELSSADFEKEKIEDILAQGEIAAQLNKEALLVLVEDFIPDDKDMALNVDENKLKIVETVSVSGRSSYPIQFYFDALGLHPNDTLKTLTLENNLLRLRTSGLFEKIDTRIIPRSGNYIHVEITAYESKEPQIYGIEIEGNKELSFEFIYALLDFHPGDPFYRSILQEKIDYLFSLGYFESITYSLSLVRDNFLQLNLFVKEKPMRRLRIGYRYDDEYKLVGLIAFQATNVLLPGLREELALQFAGLFKVDYLLTYPSRTLNFPLYPYVRVSYKDVPIGIYDVNSGNKLAEYGDKSLLVGAGLKLNLGHIGELNFEYNQEYMDIKPGITGLDPSLFPTWQDNLRVFRAELSVDLLDDPIIPRTGIKLNAFYDYSPLDIKSDVNYHQFEGDLKAYITPVQKHTFRIETNFSDFFKNLPTYKYRIKGGPNSFIGVEINQLAANTSGFIRLDYRYEYKKDIFLKLIANAGYFSFNDYNSGPLITKAIYGAGIGIKFLSIIGPFEIIISKGPKSIMNWNHFATNFYFTAGFNF